MDFTNPPADYNDTSGDGDNFSYDNVQTERDQYSVFGGSNVIRRNNLMSTKSGLTRDSVPRVAKDADTIVEDKIFEDKIFEPQTQISSVVPITQRQPRTRRSNRTLKTNVQQAIPIQIQQEIPLQQSIPLQQYMPMQQSIQLPQTVTSVQQTIPIQIQQEIPVQQSTPLQQYTPVQVQQYMPIQQSIQLPQTISLQESFDRPTNLSMINEASNESIGSISTRVTPKQSPRIMRSRSQSPRTKISQELVNPVQTESIFVEQPIKPLSPVLPQETPITIESIKSPSPILTTILPTDTQINTEPTKPKRRSRVPKEPKVSKTKVPKEPKIERKKRVSKKVTKIVDEPPVIPIQTQGTEQFMTPPETFISTAPEPVSQEILSEKFMTPQEVNVSEQKNFSMFDTQTNINTELPLPTQDVLPSSDKRSPLRTSRKITPQDPIILQSELTKSPVINLNTQDQYISPKKKPVALDTRVSPSSIDLKTKISPDFIQKQYDESIEKLNNYIVSYKSIGKINVPGFTKPIGLDTDQPAVTSDVVKRLNSLRRINRSLKTPKYVESYDDVKLSDFSQINPNIIDDKPEYIKNISLKEENINKKLSPDIKLSNKFSPQEQRISLINLNQPTTEQPLLSTNLSNKSISPLYNSVPSPVRQNTQVLDFTKEPENELLNSPEQNIANLPSPMQQNNSLTISYTKSKPNELSSYNEQPVVDNTNILDVTTKQPTKSRKKSIKQSTDEKKPRKGKKKPLSPKTNINELINEMTKTKAKKPRNVPRPVSFNEPVKKLTETDIQYIRNDPILSNPIPVIEGTPLLFDVEKRNKLVKDPVINYNELVRYYNKK